MQNAPERMNESPTHDLASAKSVQTCSLIVLARQLARSPNVPPHKRPLASLLLQQTYSYDANPDAMRPLILATIERIQTAA